MNEKIPLDEIAYRAENEGLDYAIQSYFGENLNSTDDELNLMWQHAYTLLGKIEEKLKPYYE